MPGLGSAVEYQRLEGRVNAVKSWGPHTFNFHASGGTDLGSNMPAYESFTLGGPLRLSAFRLDQFAGREYAFGRVMYYNRVMALPDPLGSGAYLGASAEVGWIKDRVDGLPSPGTLYRGLAIRRRGHVRWTRVSWYRLWHRQQFWRLLASWGALTPRRCVAGAQLGGDVIAMIDVKEVGQLADQVLFVGIRFLVGVGHLP